MKDEELIAKAKRLKDRGYSNVEIADKMNFHESTIRRLLGEKIPVRIIEDEQGLGFEQLAERWNERTKQLGLPDRWAFIDGEFVKTNWTGKKPEEPNHQYDIIDGVIYYKYL